MQCERVRSMLVDGTSRNSFASDLDGHDGAVCAEEQALERQFTMIAVGLLEGAPMVGDVPVIRARNVQNRMMPRAARDPRILLEDDAARRERPEHGWCGGIGD